MKNEASVPSREPLPPNLAKLNSSCLGVGRGLHQRLSTTCSRFPERIQASFWHLWRKTITIGGWIEAKRCSLVLVQYSCLCAFHVTVGSEISTHDGGADQLEMQSHSIPSAPSTECQTCHTARSLLLSTELTYETLSTHDKRRTRLSKHCRKVIAETAPIEQRQSRARLGQPTKHSDMLTSD